MSLFANSSASPTPTPGGLFGANPPISGGGLFSAQPTTPANTTPSTEVKSGIFGSASPAPNGNLFGGGASTTAPTTTTAPTASVFGAPAKPQADAPGNSFGAPKEDKPKAALFGGPPPAAAKEEKPSNGLFGAKPDALSSFTDAKKPANALEKTAALSQVSVPEEKKVSPLTQTATPFGGAKTEAAADASKSAFTSTNTAEVKPVGSVEQVP